jgi:hypothetical protein
MYRNLWIGRAACDMIKARRSNRRVFSSAVAAVIGETIADEETAYCALSWFAMPTAL